MSTILTSNAEFRGSVNSPHRQVTVGALGSAEITQQQVAPDGTVSWVAVPDGVLSGPVTVTLLTVPSATYRAENVVGLVTVD